MKKLILLLLTTLLPLAASAYDIEARNADGDTIFYNFINDSTELAVTLCDERISSEERKYSGDLVIPEEVTFDNKTLKVTAIGSKAFDGCTKLTSIAIPNSVTTIGDYAFWHCDTLASITIPASVVNIGYLAFLHCERLTSIEVEEGNARYDSRNDCNAIILTASNKLIKGCKETIIPSDVTIIDDWAFGYCADLTSITIPEGVTNIGNSAFTWCTGLTSLTIPQSVMNIGEWAFLHCDGLASIQVASGNTRYDSRDDCNAIILTASNKLMTGCKNTTIPNGVTSISDWAFGYCYDLTSIAIPDGVTTIGEWAFGYCAGLTSVTIPSSVTSIGDWAFSGSYSLASAVVPNSVTHLGVGVFDGCAALASVTIPNGITTIGDHLFQDCAALTSVTIPDGVTTIGSYAFWGCYGLTSVTIPNSVRIIGEEAFCGCYGLPSIDIPHGVDSIGEGAFWKCFALTSVTIPHSVTAIGNYAFFNCSHLTSVTVLNPTPVAITRDVFSNRMHATLYVLKSAKQAYLNADYWYEFKEIVELDETGILNSQFSARPQVACKARILNSIDSWHSLDGRKLQGKPTKKGLYIHGGRKTVVK